MAMEAGNPSVHCIPDVKESGYHSDGYNHSVAGSQADRRRDVDSGFEVKNTSRDFLAETGQHLYYGYFPQSPCSPQSLGSYLPTQLPGYGAQFYGHVYQQVPSSSVMHYYASSPVPSGQEEPKSKNTRPNEVREACRDEQNGAGGQSQLAESQWGSFPAVPSSVYYNTGSYEYYAPQWHLPAYGYQQTQNGVVPPPSYIAAGGCEQYSSFPRVHSAPDIAWKSSSKVGFRRPGVANWRAKDVTQHTNKGDGKMQTPNMHSAEEQIRRCCSAKSKVQQSAVPNAYGAGAARVGREGEHVSPSVSRSDYNKEDFRILHEAAKFFIIKSYSEDDVHKSIKYGVWSSTPNGNKRLDEAYRVAQEQKLQTNSGSCPVFLFFSVNSSGQFCGVAEMVGPMDFSKDMDFWLQGKWSGCLPVKWHIIKDVPNCHFRHIILANNENKPVTHSRDTHEMPFKEGLEVLKICKNFAARTSVLDDFAFYDERQAVLQERKLTQQQMMISVKHQVSVKKSVLALPSASSSKEHGKLHVLNGGEAKATCAVSTMDDLSITLEDSVDSHETTSGNDKHDDAKTEPPSVTNTSKAHCASLESEVEVGGKESAKGADYKEALMVGGEGSADRHGQLVGV